MPGGEVLGGLLEAFGQQPGDFLRCYPAGKLAGFGAAHPIAHGKDKVAGVEVGFADLAQVAHFMSIEIEGQKSVLVVRAHFSGVGHA